MLSKPKTSGKIVKKNNMKFWHEGRTSRFSLLRDAFRRTPATDEFFIDKASKRCIAWANLRKHAPGFSRSTQKSGCGRS